MTQPMNIRPEIAHREQAIQMEFLKTRVLILAQMLSDATAERDQALSELTALKAELTEGAADAHSE